MNVTGYGARSDLVPFDSPELAKAVAACPVPVFTALGHATDRTVCDMVAHAVFPRRLQPQPRL